MSHTPTELKVSIEYGDYDIVNWDGQLLFKNCGLPMDMVERKANAELIVKAVNNYQPMLEALEELFADWIPLVSEEINSGNPNTKQLAMNVQLAIKQAKGRIISTSNLT